MTLAEAEEVAQVKTEIDAFFLLTNAFIILFMQSGFAFLEAGSIRTKNVTNILIKNLADLCLGGVVFLMFGYAIAFGPGNYTWVGTTYFGMVGLPLGLYPHIFMQTTFATTCSTIVSGAIAERSDFTGYMMMSTVLTGFSYPLSTHWCWNGNGFLAQKGFSDFAGSAVVHLSGGILALVGTVFIGARKNRWTEVGHPGHSIPLTCLGAFILIFAFMSFNGGSQGSLSNRGDGPIVALASINTLVACCCGGIVGLFVTKLTTRAFSVLKLINGSLAGMVSVCASCNVLAPWWAGAVSCIASLFHIIISKMLIGLRIDDPVDAVAVHAGGGIIGIIAAPIFSPDGLMFGINEERIEKLKWNSIGAGILIAYNLGVGTTIFGILKVLNILRVSDEDEVVGMDVIKHGEKSYLVQDGDDDWMAVYKRRKMSLQNPPKKIVLNTISE